MAFSMAPVMGKEFIGREEILARMTRELGNRNSRNGFALYGKRRVGKTSALLEVGQRLSKDKQIVPIYISVWNLVEGRVEEFCRAIMKETVDAYREKIGLPFKFQELADSPFSTIPKLLKRFQLKADISDLVTLALSFRKEEQKKFL